MSENFGQSHTDRPPRPGRKPDPPDLQPGPERENRPRKDHGGIGGNDGDEPTKQEPSLIERVEAHLEDLHRDIQDSLAGTPSDDRITTPTQRPGKRPPNDELNLGLQFPFKPPEEEEPPIVPGDPDGLGERARRRSSREDVNTSPVLRRGLLGV